MLFTGAWDGTVGQWQLVAVGPPKELLMHTVSDVFVQSLAVTPTAKRLVVGKMSGVRCVLVSFPV